jgi:hypothetical protein
MTGGKFCTYVTSLADDQKGVCGFLMNIVNRRGGSNVRGNGVNVHVTNGQGPFRQFRK